MRTLDKKGNEENDRLFGEYDEKHLFTFTQTLALPTPIASQGSGRCASPHFTGEDCPDTALFWENLHPPLALTALPAWEGLCGAVLSHYLTV